MVNGFYSLFQKAIFDDAQMKHLRIRGPSSGTVTLQNNCIGLNTNVVCFYVSRLLDHTQKKMRIRGPNVIYLSNPINIAPSVDIRELFCDKVKFCLVYINSHITDTFNSCQPSDGCQDYVWNGDVP